MSQVIPNTLSSDDPRHQFHELEVLDVIRETADATSFVFEIPSALEEIFTYQPGQFFTFEIPWEGFHIKRCYSLSSASTWGEKPKVTVKRIDDGRMSNWMNDNLKSGNTIRVLPPAGLFVLNPDKTRGRPLTLFGGGSGITPVMSLLKQALRETERSVKLIYANRDVDSVIFRKELGQIVAEHEDRFAVVHHLDNESGFMSPANVQAHIADRLDSDFYICGPTPFMDTVEAGLNESALTGGDIHIERFVSATDPDRQAETQDAPPVSTGTPETVTLTLEGTTHQVDYTAGETILQAAVRAGLDVPFSCQDGYCSCCMAKLRQGEVSMATHEALTQAEVDSGWILTCQAKPITGACEVEYED